MYSAEGSVHCFFNMDLKLVQHQILRNYVSIIKGCKVKTNFSPNIQETLPDRTFARIMSDKLSCFHCYS